MKSNKWFFLLLILGLLLRIGLSVAGHNGDVNTHITWGKNVMLYGASGFYERDFLRYYGVSMANYPPLITLLFALSYFIYGLIGPLIWKLNLSVALFPSGLVLFWQNQKNVLPAIMKIWAIIADIGLAYFIYLFAQETNKLNKRESAMPLIAASLVLFNPAFVYNSAYWGQIDVIPLFFVVGAFYYLLFKKNLFASVVYAVIALLTKQTAAVFIPVYLLIVIKRFDILQIAKGLLAALIIMWFSFLPFFKSGNIILYPFITYWQKILNQFGSDYLTAHAFNFWGLTTGLGHIKDTSLVFLGFTYRSWSQFFLYLNIVVILFFLFKSKFNNLAVLWSLFLIPFVMFLFATRMHERHLILTLPFLLIGAANNRKLMKAFIFLSFFHFLNLYSGWWSPHLPEIITKIFSSKFVVNTLIIIVIILYFYLIKRLFMLKIQKNA